MLLTLINKELRAIILSPKFVGTFVVCSVLILLSIYAGINEFKTMQARYEANTNLVEQEMRESTSWGNISSKIYRAPDPMQIFVAGLDYDIGRWSGISDDQGPRLRNSAYSDDPIYAVFRYVDFAFIVQFVLTLFAILFTYNAINGEREDGTLKLVFSNAVSRSQYLIAKSVGSWLGLVVPICIPILLGLLLLLFFNIPTTPDFWLRLLLFMGLSILLFTFFIVLGVFVSSITKSSSVSFLASLVIWVLFILIIPRAGVMAAGTIVKTPRMAEIEGQIEGFSKERWEQFHAGLEERWAERRSDMPSGDTDNDEWNWTVMELEDSLRRGIQADIDNYDLKVREELREKKRAQENLAMFLSRLSPSSAYQIGSMSLAGTGLGMKSRYLDAANEYRNGFCQFVERKQKETGDMGGIRLAITLEDDGIQQMDVSSNRSKEQLDLTELPRFTPPTLSLKEAIRPAVVDFGLLMTYILAVFAGAFVSFLRYDVR